MNLASRAEYRNRIEQVVVYINSHLNETLDLAKVAAESHFSPYHFHRIFQGAMSETPQEYVNRVRMERAANYLMKNQNKSVTDIALACGYSSSSTFARAFKQHFGVSAREYASGRYLRSLADACNTAVCTMAKGEKPVWNVEMKNMPALHLAYLADLKGYDLQQICETWERLDRWAVAHAVYRPDTIRLGISMDDPLITPVEKCRYLAGITIPPEIKKDRTVGILDVPAMTCAVFHVELFKEQIQDYYQAVYRDWLPDSGLQPGDFPCYEIYLDTPQEPGDGTYCMDIHIPVVPI
jgi:AraC family transcriptional regulator